VWQELWPGRDANLTRARCGLITLAVGRGAPGAPQDFDVLVWLDRDISWPAGTLAQLIRHAAETRGIVGVPYPFRTRGAPGYSCRGLRTEHLVALQRGQTQLVPVTAVSGGFCAFWIPALRQGILHLQDTQDADLRIQRCRGAGNLEWYWDICRSITLPGPAETPGEFLSNDWATCYRLGSVGVPIHALLRSGMRHVGDYAFDDRDAMRIGPR
jgi:hypothetical protein